MARAGDRPAWQAQLRLPPVWFGLTCDKAVDRAQVPPQVDDYIRHMTSTKKWRIRKLRAGMVDSLLSWSAGAASLGAEVAAMRWDEDETFGMGIVTLMVRRLERDRGPVGPELETLRQMLAKESPNDEFPPRVADVALAIGPGLRMEAVRQPSDVNGQPQHLRLVVEYWIPVDDVDLVQMNFATSNLALAPVMTEEFEVIATNFDYSTEPV
jgi:hypothetical protein